MIVEQIRDAVRAGGLLAAAPALVAMLSGGRDSVCLLDVATELRGARAVAALHVNYGLRADADADERFCVELCERLGVELRVVRAAGAEGNIQAWAREVRYDAARELAEALGAGVSIATGHTASDQVETILYRLAASPGRRALLGMAEREGAIVRPLLAFTREQTAAYCRERRLDWREDTSNEDPRYARARVRTALVPALRSVHPAAESNVLRTARLLREETAVLDALVDAELQGRQSIALDRLAELAPALARMVVVRLAEAAAATYVPQAGEHVDELLALARRGGSAELHVGGGAGAVIADGVLTMRRLPPRAPSNPPPGAD
ncbi:MAG TPA: tRNA lysidine(34) synthetase TilS [Solirubrobacteraceae bacterium]|jgi:tRNA(Ile)-lysidine synthase|nr:tRNA lysidine(34) synthetase TilS [Solirubrobacteraceae bacterium]